MFLWFFTLLFSRVCNRGHLAFLGVATPITSGVDSVGCDVDGIAVVALSKAANKQ